MRIFNRRVWKGMGAFLGILSQGLAFLPPSSHLAVRRPPLVAAGQPAPATHRAPPPRLRMQADNEPIPDAIIEAEAKATPMRPVRQQAYVLIGALSAVAGGGLAASKQGGVAAADAFAARLECFPRAASHCSICGLTFGPRHIGRFWCPFQPAHPRQR